MRNPRPIDPVLVFGVLLAIGLGVVLALVTSTKVAVGFVVTMVGIVIAMQVDIIARLERRHNDEDDQARLAAMIRRVDGMFTKFEGLARAIAAIEEGSHSGSIAFKVKATRSLDELTRRLQELERQELRMPVEDTELLFEQFAHTKETLHAVSIDALDSAWRWSTEQGQRYWLANKEALDNGVTIERVFVYTVLSADLLQNMERQLRAGMKVFMVQEDRIRPALRNDVAIWDKTLVSHTQVNTAGTAIYNVYSTDPFEVGRRFREFCQVRDSAHVVTDSMIEKERSQLSGDRAHISAPDEADPEPSREKDLEGPEVATHARGNNAK